jgi:hypothetical protein
MDVKVNTFVSERDCHQGIPWDNLFRFEKSLPKMENYYKIKERIAL